VHTDAHTTMHLATCTMCLYTRQQLRARPAAHACQLLPVMTQVIGAVAPWAPHARGCPPPPRTPTHTHAHTPAASTPYAATHVCGPRSSRKAM
jgi:hypothetical protein